MPGDYKTEKNVVTNDPKIKLTYWGILSVLVLVSAIGLVYDPTWQSVDYGIGHVSYNVEGATKSVYRFGKKGQTPEEWTDEGERVYDALSLLIPDSETDSMFLATRIVTHFQQSQSQFCGDPSKSCESDIICREKHESFLGEDTYVCLRGLCLIRGWCPIQLPASVRPMQDTMLKLTISLTVTMLFPSFGAVRNSGLKQWSLENILDEVGVNGEKKWEQLSREGMVVLLTVSFDCLALAPNCEPSLEFKRLDEGHGFQWTYALLSPHSFLGEFELPPARHTMALTGIRIVIATNGRMLKASYTGLLLAIGSLLSVFGTAAVAADFILLNVHEKRAEYTLQKYRFHSDERMYRRVRRDVHTHLKNLGYF